MGKISKYFDWSEVTVSAKAASLGLNNVPSLAISKTCIVTASKMDVVREALNSPVKVLSWYRTPEVNKAVGGATNSAHMLGYAIDCTSTIMTPLKLCKFVVDMGIDFDQIIHEYGKWMHISFDPQNRKSLLTKFSGPYKKGLLTEQEYLKS